MVLLLLEKYPEFQAMYEDAYSLCLNIEEVMQMFSKELAEFDRNTIQLMIDEMQEDLDNRKRELDSKMQELNSITQELDNTAHELNNAKLELHQMISRVYRSVGDTKKTADMLGISEEAVKKVIA